MKEGIRMRTMMSFLVEEEVEKIHEASMQVLENTGVKIGSEKVRKMLVKKGAKAEGSIVKLPKPLVKQAIKLINKEILLAARDPGCDLILPAGQFPFNATSGFSPFVKDLETGVTRNSTGQDLKEFAVLCDALEKVSFFWPIVFPTDEAPLLEELCALDISLRNIRKHVQCSCSSELTAKWQIRLAGVVAGGADNLRKRPIFSAVASPISPLFFEKNVAEAMVVLAEAGIPVVPMTMSLTGTTAPATLAGTITLANAEELASLVIVKCANPDAPMIYATDAAPLDLRTGIVNYTAPEYPLLAAGCAQMARYYGLPGMVAHDASEERPFEHVSGFERGVLKVVISLMTRTDLSSWIGSLDNCLNASLIDVLLDTEACDRAFAYLRSFEVNDETLALKVIDEAGPGGHFLAHKHTLKHFRKELCTQKLQDSFIFNESPGEDYYQRAKQRVKIILAEHSVPAPEQVVLQEMDQVMDKARQDIGS